MAFRKRWGLVALLLCFSLLPIQSQAQAQTVITAAVPEFIRELVETNIIAPFEAANPDIDVQLVAGDIPVYGASDVPAYLDSFAEYAAAADILIVNETSLSVEATRNGYLLDLGPLVRADASLNPDDFYPQFWQSFQWEGGFWALPAAGDVIGILYVPERFDEAGLFYPDAFWTLTELEDAIRKLSEVDETTGKVTKSAYLDFTTNGSAGILLSLAGQGVYDPSGFSTELEFNTATLEGLLDEWKVLADDGLFTAPQGELNLNAPMVVAQSLFATFTIPGVDVERKFAPLPGGRSPLNVNGLAISAGSQNPEAAYRLIKFTTESSAITTAFISALPARRTLVGVASNVDDSNNLLSAFITGPSPEQIAELEGYLASSYTIAEALLTPYISIALNEVVSGSKDAPTALQDAEQKAVEALQLALDRAPDTVITVATPAADVAVATGEVAIKFGVQTAFGGLQNAEEWNTVAQEFADADLQIGAITVEAVPAFGGGTLSDIVEDYDCFYQSSNITASADLTLLLPIDPLIASDPNFDVNDVVGGALNQMRRQDQTWGLPMNIQPLGFWYNPATFEENAVFPPYSGWTTGDFDTALRQLKIDPEDPAPFAPNDAGGGGTYLLVLIASYGGLPADFSALPITVNFTDEATVQAIQQVLDLARDGYIDYQKLVQTGGAFFFGGNDEIYTMYSQILGGAFGATTEDAAGNEYLLTGFPQGSTFKGVGYDLGAGYISINTTNGEACYRFLSHLMTRIELFDGMPVLRSLINSDTIRDTQGDDAVEFYNSIDALLDDPQAAPVPTGFGTNAAGESVALIWLLQVFDQYVEDENTDLAFELGEAQLFANAYLECLAQAPAETLQTANFLEQYRVWRDCAIKVDPETASIFPAF